MDVSAEIGGCVIEVDVTTEISACVSVVDVSTEIGGCAILVHVSREIEHCHHKALSKRYKTFIRRYLVSRITFGHNYAQRKCFSYIDESKGF